MFLFRKKTTLPTPNEALPGRPEAIRTAKTHFINGRPLQGPYPQGMETAIFGLGCFWGAERMFWKLGDGVYVTAVGYAGGVTPNPTYEEVCSGLTGHNEMVLVVYDPKKLPYERLLRTFWEGHDPTQGMRQGNDVGTQYRSAIYATSPARRAAFLFCRGLPPAISRQEPSGLLRPRRHRRVLPDRRRHRGGLVRLTG
jgi:peptide-methionine (S)-S-oxide reductase